MDAVTHLDSARRFFDSLSPGILSQLGTVWLPIPHLILLPAAYIDVLWHSGLAGSLIGIFCYSLTAMLIFKTALLISKDKTTRWLAFAIFAFNPNILYLQTTAMTESVFYLLLFTAMYFLLKWQLYHLRFDLISAGLFSALAMGTRYEAWFMVTFVAVIIATIYIRRKSNPVKGLFLYFSLPVFFVLLWMLHNFIYYDDPLYFQRGEYSSQALMKPFEESGYLPAKGSISLSTELFLRSVLSNLNPLLLLIATAGFIIYLFKNKLDNSKLIPYFTVSAFFVGILSLFFGQVVILLPDSSPAGYLNSRYGLIVLPFVILFTIFTYKQFAIKKNFKIFLSVIIFISSFFWIFNFPGSSGSVSEAIYFDINRPELKRASIYLLREYDGTNILFDDNSVNLYPYSKIPMKERINTHTFYWGELSLKNPSKVVGWVIMDTKSGNDDVYQILKSNADFLSFYTMVHNDQGIEIYKRTTKTY
ncbi:MAG: phospholipid carrier-dependent glycosyltransferase [Ignavibacteria bacterium]|nr:phospholipid carrier-dependent glycosyltransferase [Ignavibacteria bacterium]